MKKILLLCCLGTAVLGQGLPKSPAEKPAETKKTSEANNSRVLDPDMSQTTMGEITVKGQKVPYKATVGTQPVWDENGKIIASCFYTYYERSDVKDKATRPLVFSFNGGPGTASVWMHMAYTGPKVLNIDDEGFPLQPYGYKDNAYSLLDVADIIFIDPVNTGFSRIIQTETPKTTFFGVKADIKYLADWLNTFVSRANRWASPKYLIGESYGTNRVSGLALELQNTHWMYLNGVVLVSPTDLGIKRDEPSAAALRLPYFAATAWHHKVLKNELLAKDLEQFLPEVEEFTVNQLLPAMAKGGYLPENEKASLANTMAKYSGIDPKLLMQNNLDIELSLFWKELLRQQGFTIGRLDSRYKGIDSKDGGEKPEFNAELSSWLHAFTPPINMYLREELKFKTDLPYYMFGPVHPWQRDEVNLAENLRAAMAANPFLKVLTQSGYYDGACDYFNAKYNLWQLDPSGKTKSRLSWKGYRSGHMMYLRKEDLQKANEDLREFIKNSLPAANQPAKY
jgi:carboxypeptidase C (cathepsin A)